MILKSFLDSERSKRLRKTVLMATSSKRDGKKVGCGIGSLEVRGGS